jgi:hypothetical protein
VLASLARPLGGPARSAPLSEEAVSPERRALTRLGRPDRTGPDQRTTPLMVDSCFAAQALPGWQPTELRRSCDGYPPNQAVNFTAGRTAPARLTACRAAAERRRISAKSSRQFGGWSHKPCLVSTTVSPTLSARSGVMGRAVLMLMVTSGTTREPARNDADEREADRNEGVVEVTLRLRCRACRGAASAPEGGGDSLARRRGRRSSTGRRRCDGASLEAVTLVVIRPSSPWRS